MEIGRYIGKRNDTLRGVVPIVLPSGSYNGPGGLPEAGGKVV